MMLALAAAVLAEDPERRKRRALRSRRPAPRRHAGRRLKWTRPRSTGDPGSGREPVGRHTKGAFGASSARGVRGSPPHAHHDIKVVSCRGPMFSPGGSLSSDRDRLLLHAAARLRTRRAAKGSDCVFTPRHRKFDLKVGTTGRPPRRIGSGASARTSFTCSPDLAIPRLTSWCPARYLEPVVGRAANHPSRVS